MACPGSYTVLIIPLHSRTQSLDALHFFLWLKRLRDLERAKDSLWTGLQVLEQAQLWYQRRLEENQARHASVGTEVWEEGGSSCMLRSRVQRVNGSLGSLMCDPHGWSCPLLPQEIEDSDSDLRWQNTVLAQEVSEKNHQISMLELERKTLLQQLGEEIE